MSSPFGSPQSNQPSPGGGFGAPNPGFGGPPSGFGAPASGGPGFGAPASSAFGSPAPAQGFGADSSTSKGFDEQPPTATGPLTFRSGPWSWVLAAMGAAVVGLILGVVAHFGPFTATETPYLGLSLVGWALAGIATFVLLGVYISEDTKRQAEGPYIGVPGQIITYRAAAVIGLIAVVITAIEIALYVSKSGVF